MYEHNTPLMAHGLFLVLVQKPAIPSTRKIKWI
jgi:hypothetical protein